MKITQVRAVPMSDPVPVERRHRTDLGTKVKTDSAIIFVDTDTGLTGMGAAELACGAGSAITKRFTSEDAPARLPPQPFREIGMNAVLRWREWMARKA